MEKLIGQTMDGGFQVGVRKSMPVPLDEAWNLLFSEKGLHIWLGELRPEELAMHAPFATGDGITGMVTTLNPYVNIRMRWKKKSWEQASILQVRVIEGSGKTTISFHQEKLADQVSRNEMKMHWTSNLDKLATEIKTGS